jgi:hypothetical protein
LQTLVRGLSSLTHLLILGVFAALISPVRHLHRQQPEKQVSDHQRRVLTRTSCQCV